MSESSIMPTSVQPRQFSYIVVIAALMLAEGMAAFESGMIYLAIPSMMAAFDSGIAQVGWVVTAYYLVAAVSAGICGRIGDQFGRKKLILWLIAFATVGSFLSLVSDSLGMVIIGRGLQGASGAILPLAVALARSTAPSTSRAPMGISAVSASAVAGGSLGVVVAGVMIQVFSWHAIFIFSGVLGVLAFAAVALLVPRDEVNPEVATARMDYVGAILLAPAIALILLAITSGRSLGWLSGSVLGMAASGFVIFAAWVWWELRVESPLIELRDFTQRHLAITMLATVAGCAMFNLPSLINSVVLQGPADATLGLGISSSVVGLISCICGLAAFALLPVVGRIAAKRGGGQVLIVAAISVLVTGLCYLFGYSSFVAMLGGVFFGAVTSMFVTSALPILVTEAVPEERTAASVGATAVVRATATSVIAAIGTAIFASSTTPGTNQPDVTGLVRVLIFLGVCALIALICGYLLRFKSDREIGVGNSPSTDQVRQVPAQG